METRAMSAATTTHSFEDDVNRYFDRAAAFTGHPQGLLEQIRACNSVHTFQFPVRHGDGRIKVIRAWRPSIAITGCQRRAASGSADRPTNPR
jgi:glutamate dehydrogenase (NAD(P)+)